MTTTTTMAVETPAALAGSTAKDTTTPETPVILTHKQLLQFAQQYAKEIVLPHGASHEQICALIGPETLDQWKDWLRFSRMTCPQLRRVLGNRGDKKSGKKKELLDRLGVPADFGLPPPIKNPASAGKLVVANPLKMIASPDQKVAKVVEYQSMECGHDAAEQQQQQLLFTKHVSYACCPNPQHPSYGDPNAKPVGYIEWPDRSVMEVFSCMTCGKMPDLPNAPAIHKYPPDYDCEDCNHLMDNDNEHDLDDSLVEAIRQSLSETTDGMTGDCMVELLLRDLDGHDVIMSSAS